MYTRNLGDAASAPAPATTLATIAHSDSVKTGAAIALTFHGYRRTGSLIWAMVYGLCGRIAPVVAVPVALAQGFGERKPCP